MAENITSNLSQMGDNNSDSSSVTSTTFDLSNPSSENGELCSCVKCTFEQMLEERDDKINDLEMKIETLKETMSIVESEVDEISMYARREALEILGTPAVTQGENCKEVVIEMLTVQLRLNVRSSDIYAARRVGYKPRRRPDVRNIIFKVRNMDLKHEILRACRQLRPNFYINEVLTPTRSKILYALRCARRIYPSRIKGFRITDGSIVVLLTPRGRESLRPLRFSLLRKVAVNTRLDMEELLEKEFNVSSADLGISWNI